MKISKAGEAGLLDSLNKFITLLLKSKYNRSDMVANYPYNLPIELGNSCRIFHGGVIRQLMFANYLKRTIEDMSNGLLLPYIVYYENDTTPCLLPDSRGIALSHNEEIELITFGYASKKKSVMSQNEPTIESIERFLDKVRSNIHKINGINLRSHDKCIKNLMDTLVAGCRDLNEKEKTLNHWYRSINEIILDRFDMPIPKWVAVSTLLSPKSEINASTLEIIDKIYEVTTKVPLWACIDEKRRRITPQAWSDKSNLLKDKCHLAPDVILRQLTSSMKGPVIRLHGSFYNYFQPIDMIDTALGHLTIRIIYDHNVSSEKNSIHYLHRVLNDSLDSFIDELKSNSLFSDIKLL